MFLVAIEQKTPSACDGIWWSEMEMIGALGTVALMSDVLTRVLNIPQPSSPNFLHLLLRGKYNRVVTKPLADEASFPRAKASRIVGG